MTSIIYSGVDPGKSGAIASINQDGTVVIDGGRFAAH